MIKDTREVYRMELRKIRKLTLWLCTMFLIVMFAGSACAEKS